MNFKKSLSILMTICMLLAYVPHTLALSRDGEGAVHFYGDVNFDEKLNTADATLQLKFAASMTVFTAEKELALTSEGYMKADANKDMTVNTADAAFILKVSAGMINANTYTDAAAPTTEPTGEPTAEPTGEPTAEPTGEPTDEPTPTQAPTPTPTSTPAPTPDSIEIANKADFLKIGVDPAYGMNKKYVVTADIDFGGETLFPRGYVNGTITNFTGKFDGQGHKFSNFSFAYLPDAEGSGLFYINHGIITNLYVDCSPCTITVASSGMICYENSGSGQIRGCGTSGKMVYKAGNSWLAGIASSNMATIDQCWTNVEIEACTELIDNAEGYVDAGYSGMITAYAYGGTISNCITFGSISGSYIGAIFGQNSAGQATGLVTNCYSLSKVDFYHPEMYFNEIGFTPLVGAQMYYPNCTGFFYLKGQTYKEGELYPNKDNNQYTNSYYGCALDADGFNHAVMNMYDTSIWDFSGTYPVLRNCAGMTNVTVAPYAG